MLGLKSLEELVTLKMAAGKSGATRQLKISGKGGQYLIRYPSGDERKALGIISDHIREMVPDGMNCFEATGGLRAIIQGLAEECDDCGVGFEGKAFYSRFTSNGGGERFVYQCPHGQELELYDAVINDASTNKYSHFGWTNAARIGIAIADTLIRRRDEN